MAGAGSGKILVIRGGALGDFVLTLPALRLVRETLPAAHIEVLGYRPIVDLAVLAGYADSARSIEYSAMAGFFAPGSRLDEELEAYFASFSVVVSYLFDPDGFFRGNLERAGVKTIIQGPHRVVEPGIHAARQLAEPLGGLAMFLDDGGAAAEIRGSDVKERELIAWHPGSGSPTKNWPVECWVRVFERMGLRHLALVTGEAETERCGEIEQALRAAGISFDPWRGLGLDELADRLRSVSLFFGHDSGVSHLAAACGAPCVLVFGPTDPEVWAPQNEGVGVARAPDGDLAKLEPEAVAELVKGSGRP